MRLRLTFLSSVLLTTLLVLFLWLPLTTLCGGALWQAARVQPQLLLEALPLRPLQRSLFFNSVTLAALSGALSCLLGLFPALALARGPKIARPVVALLTALPLALPPTLMATAWLEITRTPPARSLASLAADKPLPVSGVFIAAPILALCFFPIAAFALAAALRALPSQSEEAAHLFGSPWEAFKRFYLPLLTPALIGATSVCGALAMWEMGACDLLDARTYSVEIYRAFNAGGEDTIAALRSLPMLLMGLLLLWPALRALRFYERWEGATRREVVSTKSGGVGLAVSLLLFGASLIGPVWVFIKQLSSGGSPVIFDVWRDNAPELSNTITMSSLAAPLLAAIAFGVVAVWRSWSPKGQKIALAAGVLPLLFPPITLGVALIGFYNRDAFALVYGGLPPTGNGTLDWLSENIARYAMLQVGYAARFLPMALWIIWEASRRIDNSLLEAAHNLGASPARANRTVLLPLLTPVLLGMATLLWALCAGELTVSVLVNQPGGQTLPVPIFNLMHIGESDRVAALSLTLFGLCAVVVILGGLLIWAFKAVLIKSDGHIQRD